VKPPLGFFGEETVRRYLPRPTYFARPRAGRPGLLSHPKCKTDTITQPPRPPPLHQFLQSFNQIHSHLLDLYGRYSFAHHTTDRLPIGPVPPPPTLRPPHFFPTFGQRPERRSTTSGLRILNPQSLSSLPALSNYAAQ